MKETRKVKEMLSFVELSRDLKIHIKHPGLFFASEWRHGAMFLVKMIGTDKTKICEVEFVTGSGVADL